MKLGIILIGLVCAAVAIGALVLAIKLFSGAFALLGGVIDAILGLALILALVILVLWMFRYAGNRRK